VILEDKLALGLSAAPPERVPVESLSAEELVQQAIAGRHITDLHALLQRVAAAGAQLLGAAFAFMGEMFAGREETDKTREVAQILKHQLAQCMEQEADVRLKMTETLPDDSALDTLARSLAQIIGGRLG